MSYWRNLQILNLFIYITLISKNSTLNLHRLKLFLKNRSFVFYFYFFVFIRNISIKKVYINIRVAYVMNFK